MRLSCTCRENLNVTEYDNCTTMRNRHYLGAGARKHKLRYVRASSSMWRYSKSFSCTQSLGGDFCFLCAHNDHTGSIFIRRRVTRRQYRAALDHMSARAGTGVPIGGAENALAFLYRQGERVWEFLDAFLLGLTRGIATTASTADQRDATNDSRGSILDKNFESEALSVTEQDRTVEHQNQELSDCDKPDSDLGKSTNSWSILQLSTALSAFIFGRKGQGDTLHNQDVRDLMNFLYLEDQAKVNFIPDSCK